MRAIVRRLRQLEGRLAPEVDHRTCETASLLRERRRRRLEASGQPFLDVPRTPTLAPRKCMSVAETLRNRRRERLTAAAPDQKRGGIK